MCQRCQKFESDVEKYGCLKFSAMRMPNSSDMPRTMSMPPEKSPYCWMVYSNMP